MFLEYLSEEKMFQKAHNAVPIVHIAQYMVFHYKDTYLCSPLPLAKLFHSPTPNSWIGFIPWRAQTKTTILTKKAMV